jgi:Viral BACON domain
VNLRRSLLTPHASAFVRPNRYDSRKLLTLIRWSWIVLTLLTSVQWSIPAKASSGGISGFSGKTTSTCTSCHSGSTNIPTITLSGPTSVASGSTNSYTLSVSVVTAGNGGLDVAASAGTFAAGTGTRVLNGEITHSAPSSTHSWTFSWTAPTVTATTTATLYAAAIDSYGGGTGTIRQAITVNAPAPAPTIGVSPASLTFNYQSGGTVPAAQNVAVSSSGTAFNYTVSTSATWLTATPASGSTPGSVSVSVNPAALAAGTYTGTVSITSATTSNSPKTVAVTLNVTPAPLPTIAASPASLTFNYQSGGTVPAAQNVAVSSSGTAFNYTVSTSATWLTATPASGSTPGNVSVSVNPASLVAGMYTGTVSIASAGASNSPKTVAVTLNVTAAALPTLTASPASLSFTYQIGGSSPAAQPFSVASSGAAVNFTTATSATWLSATPSGTTGSNVSVSINPSGLAAGTYNGNVTITSAGAANSPKVAVSLIVTAAPVTTLTVSPASLSFTYQAGGSAPAGQMINVTGSGALSYSASSSSAWLTVAPASGNTPGSLTASVNPSGLAAGTYNGTVTVTAAGASNSPQMVSVSLTVTAAPSGNPSLNISPATLSFSYPAGSTTAGTQTVTVASSGSALSITAAASGGAWLTVSPGSGSTPSTLTVSANPSGLAAGTYNGNITITSSGASNSPQVIPVKLVITTKSGGTGRLRVWPSKAAYFEYEVGHSTPAPRTVRVSSSGGPLSFTAAALGGTWVSVTPSGGTTPGSLTISVDPTGLASGTYTATVAIAATGSAGVNLPVILKVASGDDSGGDDSTSGDALAVSGDTLRAWAFAYDPASSNTVAATWMDGTGVSSTASSSSDTRNQGLLLSKTSAASNQAQAGIVVRDVEGMSLTQLGYDIRNGGQCTATTPRFAIVTTDDVVHKIGCTSGTTQPAPAAGWKRLRFDPANPAQTNPPIAPGSKIKSLYLVMDGGPETGASIVVLDNVDINGKIIGQQ